MTSRSTHRHRDVAHAGPRLSRGERGAVERSTSGQPVPIVRLVVTLVVVAVVVWAGMRAAVIVSSYRTAVREMEALQALGRRDLRSLSRWDLVQAEDRIMALDRALARIDRATSVPLGDRLIPSIPAIGPYYEAMRALVHYGRHLAATGTLAAQISYDVAVAFDATGASAPDPPAQPTWLDVLGANRGDVARIADNMAAAQAMRAELDIQRYPASLREWLRASDRLLGPTDTPRFASEDFPALLAALGAERTRQYLLVVQHPTQWTPGGGIPAAAAMVTIERGQLRGKQLVPLDLLSEPAIDDERERAAALPPLVGVRPDQARGVGGLLWDADFPTSAQQVAARYETTAGAALDGVIAVQPSVLAEVLRIIGPVTITLDGASQSIDADQFSAGLSGSADVVWSNEVIAQVTEQTIARLTVADRRAVLAAGAALQAAAGRRDIQLYSTDITVQNSLDRYGWTGRAVPQEDLPTLAVAYGLLTPDRPNTSMVPQMVVTAGRVSGSQRMMSLRVALAQGLGTEEAPASSAWERWWVEIHLPEGSEVLKQTRASLVEGDVPSGGSYLFALSPEKVGEVELTFAMPLHESLLIRRQPGRTLVDLTIAEAGCRVPPGAPLTADLVVDLDRLCN